MYDGISWSTSIFVEAFTTKLHEVGPGEIIPGFEDVGVNYPAKEAKELRVAGTVSFPGLGRYSENFNEIFTTNGYPGSIPLPDYNPAYTEHHLYYFGQEVDIQNLSISLRFADLDLPKRESYTLNPIYPNNTFQLFDNLSL